MINIQNLLIFLFLILFLETKLYQNIVAEPKYPLILFKIYTWTIYYMSFGLSQVQSWFENEKYIYWIRKKKLT